MLQPLIQIFPRADRQRRITESFSKATEQLASEKIEARLGGIYTLERISRESPDDYWIVMETLTAFVREHARWKEPDKIATQTLLRPCDDENSEDKAQPRPATDIAAILTVIGRRDEKNRDREWEKSNLWELDLRGSDLRGAELSWGTHLEGADLGETHFEGATLVQAHLEDAYLKGAHLERALLIDAHLEGADLSEAHLEGANLKGAHLESANLRRAHLEGADLKWAHLEEARLGGAHLEGADLGTAEGLVLEQITQASGNNETILPQGLTRPEHWTEW